MNSNINIAVLVSGGGTNLQALIDAHRARPFCGGNLALVVASKPGVAALDRAAAAGIPAVVMDRTGDRAAITRNLTTLLQNHNIDFVVLAGFLFILDGDFPFPAVNIHPSLLPHFGGEGCYGIHVHEKVLASRAAQTGATVHIVTETVDGGDILAQKAIDVRPDDTPQSLQLRVMEECERPLLVDVVRKICLLSTLQGAIFDLDGTILDTMGSWSTLASDYLRTKGIEPAPDLFQHTKTMTHAEAATYMQTEYHLDLPIETILAETNGIIGGWYHKTAAPKPGIVAFVRALHTRGVRLSVVTATARELALAALERLGIADCFALVRSCADFGSGKDTPEIFFDTQTVLGTPTAATTVFEDAIHAAETAARAGFPVVGVYDDAFRDEQPQMHELCAAVIRDWNELNRLPG